VSGSTTRLPTLVSALALGALALVLTLWQQIDAGACVADAAGTTAVGCEESVPDPRDDG
jgi:hypothetical protein